MSDMQVKDLEKAIIDRAKTLALEYEDRANQAKDEILHEAHERLRLKEDREVQISKQLAERDYARHIQANELKYQRKLDTLRWNLVQSVITQLTERLHDMSEQHAENYQHLLGNLIREACNAIDEDDLIVYTNSSDQRELSSSWDTFIQKYTNHKNITLSSETIDCIGGALITDSDNTTRVDNTFEGRIERMEDELNQTILENLFSSVEKLGSLHTS